MGLSAAPPFVLLSISFAPPPEPAVDAPFSRIAVIGAGAIGGVTACRLAAAHPDLQIACKNPEIVQLARGPGLHVFSPAGHSRVRLNAVAQIEDLAGPLEVVFLATKAMDTADASRRLLPLLTPEAAVVSLQNGICEEELATVLGPERVVGCVVGWGASHHGPGDLEITSPGEFVVGEWGRPAGERLRVIQRMLQAVVPTRITENILGELYAKLIINACINSLGVLTGQPLGRLLASRRARNLFTGVMREAMAVAQALGIKVAPGGGGRLDYYRFLANRGAWGEFCRHLTICLVGLKYRRIRSSSLQSIERGRPSEIPFLNGYICRRGLQAGVPTPLNQAIVDLVAQIEEGLCPIAPANLRAPALAVY
ncbi:MAG: 2-dehydropantoate 2-reductase [Desulfarculus sp.]|nr:MAG: 2-dehydropantoate 2-reductase [Desulfarculus sp.]